MNGFERVLAMGVILLIAAGAFNLYYTRPWEPDAEARPAPAQPEHPDQRKLNRIVADQRKRLDGFATLEQAEVERDRRQLELSDAVAATMAETQRWKILPGGIETIYSDPSGRAWFSVKDRAPRSVLQACVEEAARSGNQLIRGGKILLVDSAGRYWARASNEPHLLLCFDGKNWTERLASGESDLPPGIRIDDRWTVGEFVDAAVEDTFGNVYFVGGSIGRTGIGIHRLDKAGNWSFNIVCEPRGNDQVFFQRKLLFVRQRHGQLALFSRFETGGPEWLRYRVIVYDGSSWTHWQVPECADNSHGTEQILPLPDGSLASFCKEDEHGVIIWPPVSAFPARERLTEMTDQLVDPDPAVRETAFQDMLALGPNLRGKLAELTEMAALPEQVMRLKELGVELAKMTILPDRDEPQQALYAGRFTFDRVHFLSKTIDGSVRLLVHNCKDRRHFADHEHAIITIDPRGVWTIAPAPLAQWRQEGLDACPQNCFEDSTGLIWVGLGLGLDRQLKLLPLMPAGISVNQIFCGDREGRVYFDSRKTLMLHDPGHPDAAPDLPLRVFGGNGFTRLRSDDYAWTCLTTGAAPRGIARLSAGGVEPVPVGWDEEFATHVIPLGGGGAIARIDHPDPDARVPEPFRLWDGANWSAAGKTVRELVHQNAKTLIPMGDPHFLSHELPVQALCRLGGDGESCLWLLQRRYEQDGNRWGPKTYFEVFDGDRWHDAAPALAAVAAGANYVILGAADGGKRILVLGGTSNELFALGLDGGTLQARPLSGKRNPGESEGNLLHGPERSLWLYRDTPKGPKTFEYRDGDFVLLENVGRPMFADSRRRLWCWKPGELHVKDGPATASLLIDGLIDTSRLSESPDGRLWLLHRNGVSEIVVATPGGSGTGLALSRGATYRWNAPWNVFRAAFCDRSDGLWIAGSGYRHARLQLPPGKSQ